MSFVIAWHPFQSSGHPDSAENLRILAELCPNNEFVWVQTTAEAFQSHNWLMRNVCKVCNPIRPKRWCANTQLSMKMAPKLRHFEARNKHLDAYHGQKMACAWIQFDVKLFQSFDRPISKVYGIWEGNSTCHCYPMTPVSVQRTPRFGIKMTNFGCICVQIMSVRAFRLLQNHSKVIIHSWAMSVKRDILFARNFAMQTHCHPWKWRPNCAILDQKWAAVWLLWSKYGMCMDSDCCETASKSKSTH